MLALLVAACLSLPVHHHLAVHVGHRANITLKPHPSAPVQGWMMSPDLLDVRSVWKGKVETGFTLTARTAGTTTFSVKRTNGAEEIWFVDVLP